MKEEPKIEILKKGGKILTKIFKEIEKNIKEGANELYLEKITKNLIEKYNAKPAFLNYKGFPSVICISKNETIVHDIPENKNFKNRDLVKIDLGIKYKGFYFDCANTYYIGDIEKNKIAKNLILGGKKAFFEVLKILKEGTTTHIIGKTIEESAKKFKLNPIKALVGHGIGKKLHKDPQIPCYLPKQNEIKNYTLKNNDIIALEVMLSAGSINLSYKKNKFGIKTKDNSLTSHFEETILIKKNGALRITKIIDPV